MFFNKGKNTGYKCAECGEYHDNWPALVYNAPVYYSQLSAEDKERIASLDRDFCVIEHSDQIDRFIRVVLFQKVVASCEDLHYGLWVSLSEKSFLDYKAHYDVEDYEACYFGWISNDLEGGSDTLSIPVDVMYKGGSNRPEVIPHGDYSHPFVEEYYNGISIEEAQKRVINVLKGCNSKA
ncbi:DUF2199 domain-containing protein [Flavobacterium rakeshii]|uniref:DUF2199 domain-containing protein n=2 Tax=Flavobacterium rakeshii TaxID=1038845 RepID=A0A6N8HCC4_9FLAO|nr:DUF2199 domain-containing protein [Flavobacterium rakeshii]